MQKNNNLQEIFLTKARKQSIPLTIFLMNGFQLRGVVTGPGSYRRPMSVCRISSAGAAALFWWAARGCIWSP